MGQAVLFFIVAGSFLCSVYSLHRGSSFTTSSTRSRFTLSARATTVGKLHLLAPSSANTVQSSAVRNRNQLIDNINQDADKIMQSVTGPAPQLQSEMEHENEFMHEKSGADTNWSGQGTMEVIRISQRNWSDLLARSGLATVDVLALFTFAVISRLSHNEPINLLWNLRTAAPFIVSWCLLSPWMGAYTRESTASLKEIPKHLLPGWAVSVPTTLAISGLINGAVPPLSFIVVSVVSTFIALWLFRSLYVLAAGDTSDAEQRDAGPLEMFAMLSTLLKRW